MTFSRLRSWSAAALAAVVTLLVVQLVPYGGERTNPSTRVEPRWDSPVTRALARDACFDCHSNETQWPAYSRLAPVSWLIQHDVKEGRSALNFSEWQRPQKDADEAAEVVTEGEMPPAMYRALHPHARLTRAQRDQLARGLATTFTPIHSRR